MNKPFSCNTCGIAIGQNEIGSEHKIAVMGTAGTRNRGVVRSCRECYAAGEYKQYQYRQQLQDELLATLNPDERERMMARRALRS